jgi:hypothetical protein
MSASTTKKRELEKSSGLECKARERTQGIIM